MNISYSALLAVQVAMPCAMVPVLLSRNYRGDTGIAAQIVLASTALGLLTISLWLSIALRMARALSTTGRGRMQPLQG